MVKKVKAKPKKKVELDPGDYPDYGDFLKAKKELMEKKK